jgi:hypothetical protein
VKTPCTDCRTDKHDAEIMRRKLGTRAECLGCGKVVDGERVYFGVVGPFCCVPCRNRWNERKEPTS